MKTVKEVSRFSGVSVRTLHHYDAIGLLRPTQITQSGYRLYDDTALERLQMILLFRELEFPLRHIKEILDSPNFDKQLALKQQRELLLLKKERLERLIELASLTETIGVNQMDFSAFDRAKLDDYAAQAKAKWGTTAAYEEYETKSEGRSKEAEAVLGMKMMEIFKEIGAIRHQTPDCAQAQLLVKKLQDYITAHYYTCTPEIFRSLAKMYGAGGEMTENIDKVGGEGTGIFAQRAVEFYCGK